MVWRVGLFSVAMAFAVACAPEGDGTDDGSQAGVVDSDGDGISDADEQALGLDPQSADSDQDGLDDSVEIDLGTDPLNPDTDEDTLDDGDEVDLGTDPLAEDSDGDTYRDGDEVFEGQDPLKKANRIYKGYWPYYRDKDEALGDRSFDGGPLSINDKFPRHVAKDHNGDTVDLYDFGAPGHGYAYLIVDASAEWCGPCQATSLWLAGGPDYYDLEPTYGAIREAVDTGELMWLTVMTQNSSGQPGDQATCERWDDAFGHEHVPVIADPNSDVEDFIVGYYGGWPAGVAVKRKTMKVQAAGHVLDAAGWVLGEL